LEELAEAAVWPEATGPLRDLLGELLLWNLPRGAADQYAGHLGLVQRASRELGVGADAAREILWRLAGGGQTPSRRYRGVGWRSGWRVPSWRSSPRGSGDLRGTRG